ncbi:MAG: hypothetical protein H7A41_05270 [Chlamydiales bacterium]|nr:hypothetical protein [Chlamydiia bacterium]MCP5504547.1 hypothetical protein [Chlamydiales bacterium]
MANRVDGGGSSWWSCFCCCRESSQPSSPRETDRLINPINEGNVDRDAQPPRRGSPQPTYSSYQTRQDVDGSPMK